MSIYLQWTLICTGLWLHHLHSFWGRRRSYKITLETWLIVAREKRALNKLNKTYLLTFSVSDENRYKDLQSCKQGPLTNGFLVIIVSCIAQNVGIVMCANSQSTFSESHFLITYHHKKIHLLTTSGALDHCRGPQSFYFVRVLIIATKLQKMKQCWSVTETIKLKLSKAFVSW